MNTIVKVPVELDDLSLDIKIDPTSTANRGLIATGSGPFDGAATGHFAGATTGTYFSINSPSGYNGDWLNYQKFGVSQYQVANRGSIRTPLMFMGNSRDLVNSDVPLFTAIVGAPDYFVVSFKPADTTGVYINTGAPTFWLAYDGLFYICTDDSNGAPYVQFQLDSSFFTARDGSAIGAVLRSLARPINLWGFSANTGTGTACRILWQLSGTPLGTTRLLSIGWTSVSPSVNYTETASFLQNGTFNLTGLTTSANQLQYSQIPSWADPNDSIRKARITFNVYDTAIREAFRIEASGSAPMIGFLGANAIARPTISGSWAGNAAGQSLAAALASLGLVTNNTTA